jgi:hypothetical protein
MLYGSWKYGTRRNTSHCTYAPVTSVTDRSLLCSKCVD